MPGAPTSRFAIPTLAGSTFARAIDTEVNDALAAIDSKMTGYSSGTLGSRPTSTPGSPGVEGRIYRATDTGQLFMDTGTSWDELTFNQAGFIAGDLKTTARATAPAGWMMCDGSLVSRTGDTAALFAAIGIAYGAGDGSTTFALPNLKGRVPVGRDAAQAEFDTLGEAVGAKTVALATGELPAHAHGDGTLAAANGGAHAHGHTLGIVAAGAHGHAFGGFQIPGGSSWGGGFEPSAVLANTNRIPVTPSNFASLAATDTAADHTHVIGGAISGVGDHAHDVTGSTANAGSGQAHSNIQPSVVVNYMIKL